MRGPWHRWCRGVPSLPQAVLTLSLTTSQGGIFWFTLVDIYNTCFGLIILAFFMRLGIAFCYGEHSRQFEGAEGCSGVQPACG